MPIDLSDIFGTKARKERDELLCEINRVRPLLKHQEALANGVALMEQMVARVSVMTDPVLAVARMEYELIRFLEDDRKSGAFQVNLEAQPLLLVVELGLDGVVLALVRAGMQPGSDAIKIANEARVVKDVISINRFEKSLATWLYDIFTLKHPRIASVCNGKTAHESFMPAARRLLASLCMGGPEGEVEESITVDSKTFTVTVPLTREALRPHFAKFLGSGEGLLAETVRSFLMGSNRAISELDRVVCLGLYSRMHLVTEIMIAIFQCPVLLNTFSPTIAGTELPASTIYPLAPIFQSSPVKLHIINSDHHQAETQTKKGFQVMGDVVLDTRTGLIWARNDNVAGKKMSWDDAMKWVKTLNLAGYHDWRLPTKDELVFLSEQLNEGNFNSAFHSIQKSNYWSSTTHAYYPDIAWDVTFYNGYANYSNKYVILYVRCVRGGL